MRGKFIMSDKKKQIDFVLKNIIKALDEERIELRMMKKILT